jgi:hypothetical protein
MWQAEGEVEEKVAKKMKMQEEGVKKEARVHRLARPSLQMQVHAAMKDEDEEKLLDKDVQPQVQAEDVAWGTHDAASRVN